MKQEKTKSNPSTTTLITQAQARLKDFNKAFGAFVHIWNVTNGTKLSVKSAANNDQIVSIFNNVKSTVSASSGAVKSQLNTTKVKSYSLVDIPYVDGIVFSAVFNNPGSSRAELAKITGRKLSTVCGSISRLQSNDLVYVSGVTTDEETSRSVETLMVK